MTDTNLLHAMGNIDPRLIAEAAPDVVSRKSAGGIWLKWGAIAAGVCLAAAAALRISMAFVPSQMADPHVEGTFEYEIESVYDLPAEYDGKLLVQNLDLSKWADIDLYYVQGGDPANTDDWYSMIISDSQGGKKLVMFCMFGDATVEDWKAHRVFTEKATQTVTINGTEVQIARNDYSFDLQYGYYAIFEYDGVVYDVRVKSEDSDYIYGVLEQMLKG